MNVHRATSYFGVSGKAISHSPSASLPVRLRLRLSLSMVNSIYNIKRLKPESISEDTEREENVLGTIGWSTFYEVAARTCTTTPSLRLASPCREYSDGLVCLTPCQPLLQRVAFVAKLGLHEDATQPVCGEALGVSVI